MSGKRRKGCIGARRTSAAVRRPTLGCLSGIRLYADNIPVLNGRIGRISAALEASHADEPAERRVWTANGEAVVVLAAFQSPAGRLSHMFI